MGEVEQDPRVVPWSVSRLWSSSPMSSIRARLEHQPGIDEIDDRHAVDILQLQMLERGC